VIPTVFMFCRQLFLILSIDVIIISITNADKSCAIAEIEVQHGIGSIMMNVTYHIPLSLQGKEMDMYDSIVRHICSEAFVGRDDVETLDLSKNRLTVLSRGLFKPLRKVSSINLSENQLTNISFDEFSGNQQLKRLNLGHNNIHTIEHIEHKGEFSITTLWMPGNNLVDISELCKLTKLGNLDLSYNTKLDFNIIKVSCWDELQILGLTDNDLKKLNNDYRVFTGLTKLQKLNLPKNNFGIFCVSDFPKLPALKELNIEENSLLVLNASELNRKFPALTKIHLAKNFWSCDYFISLEKELKEFNIAVESKVDKCVNGSSTTMVDLNSSIRKSYEDEESIMFSAHAVITWIWILLITNCILFIVAIFLCYHYFLQEEVLVTITCK
jgi:Leucine rich repeat